MKHDPDCVYPSVADGYDVTGLRVYRCYGCGSFEHEEPLFKKAAPLGTLYEWPDLEHTPFGHESGLLDLGGYSVDYTFRRPIQDVRPVVLRVPVPLAFDPIECFGKDDAREHEGVGFARLWVDAVARTLWLGYKPFMITNQYFRHHCVDHATWLRKHPEELLKEHVSFSFGDGWVRGGDSIGAQLVPFLIAALHSEGHWPFFCPGGLQAISWSRAS